MRKLLFAKEMMILALLSCCTFLSGAEKVVIQHPTDSDIESVVIEKDSLIIKSKGKTYTFKFSDLLKDKTVQAPKPVPKNLKEAFKYNGEWFFFNAIKSRRNRLCHTKKQAYKVFNKGDLLERVLYKKKYYARALNKDIFLPDWEIKKDFSPHFIPAKQYLEALNNKIRLLKINIDTIERKIPIALFIFKSALRSYNAFLIVNNIKITTIDTQGNISIKESSDKYNKKIKKELQLRYQKIQKKEEELKSLMEGLESSKAALHDLQEVKRKLDALYEKYVINNSNDPQNTLPENICF